MKFEIEDIIYQRLTPLELYKKYNRYFKEGLMFDTAPLFTILIGKLSTNRKETLLKSAFGYNMKYYDVLKKFFNLFKIDIDEILDKIQVTPQILFELISHFQKSYKYVKDKDVKKLLLNEFLDMHFELLKSKYQEILTWDIIKDERMIFLECADISFLHHAKDKKYITLLTQDSDLRDEGIKHSNILTIDFGKIIENASQIPEQLI